MILLLLFILVSAFTVILCKSKSNSYKPKPPLPPGPKSLPYIGNLITMLRNKPTLRWIHRMMDQMSTNILCIRLGNVHLIAVTHPKLARHFLKDQDAVFSSRPDCMSAYLTTAGYLTTTLVPMGDQWKKMRKTLATQILSASRHKWLQNKRGQEADNLLKYVYNQCQMKGVVTGGVVNVRTILQQSSSNMFRKMMFGSRYFGKGSACGGPGKEEMEHVDSLLTIFDYLYAFCVTDYFPWLRWITDFDGHERSIKKAIKAARKYQDPLIDHRIQQWKDGVRTKEEDLLDVFINLQNPTLTTDEIKAQILDLMLASFDNPSNGIEWAMAEMINQPTIFKKAFEELDSAVGRDRLVQESDLANLNYIKACVKEAFRLHPVAPFNLPHVSSMDTTVAGYFIPKGSHVLLSRIGLGNPEVWEEPLTFNPERHMNGDDEVVLTDHSLRMLSFSSGRRGCAGVLFGSTVTVMVMARLIQGFSWELPPTEQHVDLKESVHNLWKAKPLLALAKPRLPRNLYPTC